MQCENRSTGRMAVLLIAVLAIASISLIATEADAEQEYDVDYGRFYSYTLQFVFDGADAETIEWDFGDGSKSTEWNPMHEYSATGVYYVTQTTANSYNGGSTTVQVYKVEIMGFPVLTFEANGGTPVSAINMTQYAGTVSQVPETSRSGYAFTGWFSDPELTRAFDWSSEITQSMTLYAGWTAQGSQPGPAEPGDGDDGGRDGGSDGSLIGGVPNQVLLAILIVIGGTVCVAYIVRARRRV